VRIGVFVLSALGAVSGLYSSYIIWSVVARTAEHGYGQDAANSGDFTNNNVAYDKAQFYVYIGGGVIVSLYALFSIAGLLGSIIRNRAMVAIYSTALWLLLGVHLSFGVYAIVTDVHNRTSIKNQCLQDQNTDPSICGAATNVSITLAAIILAIEILIQLYCCIIVKRYVEQLFEEQAYRGYGAGNRVVKQGNEGGSYYPHAPLPTGQQHELGPYPYSQAEHSYGPKV